MPPLLTSPSIYINAVLTILTGANQSFLIQAPIATAAARKRVAPTSARFLGFLTVFILKRLNEIHRNYDLIHSVLKDKQS